MYFIIHCTDKPGSTKLRATNRPAHVDFLKKHRDSIFVAGPTLTQDGRPSSTCEVAASLGARWRGATSRCVRSTSVSSCQCLHCSAPSTRCLTLGAIGRRSGRPLAAAMATTLRITGVEGAAAHGMFHQASVHSSLPIAMHARRAHFGRHAQRTASGNVSSPAGCVRTPGAVLDQPFIRSAPRARRPHVVITPWAE